MEDIKINTDLNEQEEGKSEAVAEIVDQILDGMNGSFGSLTRRGYREQLLKAKEEELEKMPVDNYKFTQLEAKIEMTRRKWFPNVFWDSQKQKTYIKPKETLSN